MKKTLRVLGILFVSVLVSGLLMAAAKTESNRVVYMGTTADTYTPAVTKTIVGVKGIVGTASTYVRIRKDNISGQILWEHRAGSTVPLLQYDAVEFTASPNDPLYFQTDDTTHGQVMLYVREQN